MDPSWPKCCARISGHVNEKDGFYFQGYEVIEIVTHTHTHTHTYKLLVGEFWHSHFRKKASLVAQMVKKPSAMQETQVQSPGWEDPL